MGIRIRHAQTRTNCTDRYARGIGLDVKKRAIRSSSMSTLIFWRVTHYITFSCINFISRQISNKIKFMFRL